MNIYLHVEVKTRDLPGRILLGMNAAKQGHDVYLGDQELLELVSKKKLNPGIILEKSITPTKNRVQLLKNLKKTKSIITSIDEEGGLLLENIETFLSERMSKKTLKLINNNFFWGNYDFRYAKKIFKEFKVLYGFFYIMLLNLKAITKSNEVTIKKLDLMERFPLNS